MFTILIVDDEQSIRELAARILGRRGHKVVACSSAAEALAVDQSIDVLLVDFILPEVNGQELATALRKRWPRLPVVLMSGYLAERELMPDPPSFFLQKPMLPAAIIQAVESLLPATQG